MTYRPKTKESTIEADLRRPKNQPTKESTIEADLPLQDLPRRDPTTEGILPQDQHYIGTNPDLSTHREILMEVSTETTTENSTTTM